MGWWGQRLHINLSVAGVSTQTAACSSFRFISMVCVCRMRHTLRSTARNCKLMYRTERTCTQILAQASMKNERHFRLRSIRFPESAYMHFYKSVLWKTELMNEEPAALDLWWATFATSIDVGMAAFNLRNLFLILFSSSSSFIATEMAKWKCIESVLNANAGYRKLSVQNQWRCIALRYRLPVSRMAHQQFFLFIFLSRILRLRLCLLSREKCRNGIGWRSVSLFCIAILFVSDDDDDVLVCRSARDRRDVPIRPFLLLCALVFVHLNA